MTSTLPPTAAGSPVGSPDDQALKARHRAMWALGDYPAIVHEVIAGLGPVLVDAAGVTPGTRVLDVAAGTGNASLPAARRGATVVASDLTPELIERGRLDAEAEGLDIEWHEADAEALPFDDGSYDVVMSCIGAMFAPHHQATADELLRVARPGGTVALLSWTPEGFVGQMLATIRPYAPAPPPGAQPPPLWGRADHVTGLLGDRVDSITAQTRHLQVEAFSSGAEVRDYFKSHYGPTIVTYRSLGDDQERIAALDADLERLADSHLADGVMLWEYLLLTATKR